MPDGIFRQRAEQTALWLILIVFTAQVAGFCAANAHYVYDDWDHLARAHMQDVWTYLTGPIDLHVAPLHRLFSLAASRLIPVDFAHAAWFLGGLHLLVSVLLYLTLQTINPHRYNLYITVVLSVSKTLIDQNAWWSSALHRLPYVALTLGAILCYVRFHRSRKPVFYVAALLLYVAAFGFYSKATLIPFFIAAVIHCLQPGMPWWRTAWSVRPLWLMVGLSVAFVLVFKWRAGDIANAQPPLVLVADILWRNYMELARTFVPDIMTMNPWLTAQVAALLLLGGAVWLLTNAPGSGRAMLMLIACLALNFGVIAASQRATAMGVFLASVHRYYYEANFLVAIFLSMALARRAALTTASTSLGGLQWRICLVVVVALLSYQGALNGFERGYGQMNRDMGSYLRTLRASLAQPGNAGAVIRDEKAEPFMYKAFAFDEYLLKSQVIPLLHPSLRFAQDSTATHYIDPQGLVLPVPAVVPR